MQISLLIIQRKRICVLDELKLDFTLSKSILANNFVDDLFASLQAIIHFVHLSCASKFLLTFLPGVRYRLYLIPVKCQQSLHLLNVCKV